VGKLVTCLESKAAGICRCSVREFHVARDFTQNVNWPI
jgi:hypothetical protein